jgi:hypothetical protein
LAKDEGTNPRFFHIVRLCSTFLFIFTIPGRCDDSPRVEFWYWGEDNSGTSRMMMAISPYPPNSDIPVPLLFAAARIIDEVFASRTPVAAAGSGVLIIIIINTNTIGWWRRQDAVLIIITINSNIIGWWRSIGCWRNQYACHAEAATRRDFHSARVHVSFSATGKSTDADSRSGWRGWRWDGKAENSKIVAMRLTGTFVCRNLTPS